MRVPRCAVPFLLLLWHVVGDEGELLKMMKRGEDDVKAFADEVARLYSNRCESLKYCEKVNYDDCRSEYPSPTCPPRDHRLRRTQCGETCSGFLDFTVTSISIAKGTPIFGDGTPLDQRVIESICFTFPAEEFMKERYLSNVRFFEDEYNILEAPQMLFGSNDGFFRIFPARPLDCRSYDPRVRPWYIAASSGPKNVVLIIDPPQSVLLETAAITLLESFTDSDRVAVILNNNQNGTSMLIPTLNDDDEDKVEDGTLVAADNGRKRSLAKAIRGSKGGSDIVATAAFETAFAALKASLQSLADCDSVAVVYLTDGRYDDGSGEVEEIVSVFNDRRAELEQSVGRIMLFAYSSREEDDATKDIACRTDGLWSTLEKEDSLVDNMSNFYRFFALGFQNSAAEKALKPVWVEPYTFAVDAGIQGTTVSYPVFEQKPPNSTTLPKFLGVVGIDFTMDGLVEALARGQSNDVDRKSLEKAIERDYLQRRGQKQCPSLGNFTQCRLESLRTESGICGENVAEGTTPCNETLSLAESDSPATCEGGHPKEVLNNTNDVGKTFDDRVCCPLNGDNIVANSCPVVSPNTTANETDPTNSEIRDEGGVDESDGIPKKTVFAIAFSVSAAVLIFLCGAIFFRYRKVRKPEDLSEIDSPVEL